MKFLLSSVLAALALSASAATIAPNSVVQIQLTVNTDLCVTSASTDVGSQLTLESCGSTLTTFDLPRGAPNTTPTQLALNATLSNGGPVACISANGVEVNGPVFLDVCDDDNAQRWNVEGGAGRGPIVNSGSAAGTNCLTATSTDEGAAITFATCLGSATQEWTPVVV